MRSTTVSPEHVNSIGGRVTFRDTRLVFEDITIPLTNYAHDCSAYGTGLIRAGSYAEYITSSYILYYQYVSDVGNWGTWSNSGRALNAGAPGVHGNRVFYQDASHNIYYADIVGGVLGSATLVEAGPPDALLAPVSATEYYILWSDLGVRKIGYKVLGSPLVEWSGGLYQDSYSLNFDAVRLGDLDYVFFSDIHYRTMYMTRSGGVWSEVKDVLPLDIYDETSSFMLSHATVIDNKIFVTGILKRDYGDPMHVYSFGPPFSLGRDSYIQMGGHAEITVYQGGILPMSIYLAGGKLVLIGGELYYVGAQDGLKAPATPVVGYDNPAKKEVTQDVLGFSLSMASDQPQSLRMELANIERPFLRSGNQLDLEISYDDQYALIGKYEIDIGSRSTGEVGQTVELQARSYAMRRIFRWQPDASYDYWSQTKQDSDPAELSKMIRASGKWTGGYLEKLNVHGILYGVEKACRGMVVRGRFVQPASDFYYRPTWGLILNYYRESAQEASERLGIDASLLDPVDYGHNGIVVLYGEREHLNSHGVSVHKLEGSTLTKLTSASFLIDHLNYHWLQAEFHDGHVRVLYKYGTTWQEVLTYRCETLPWKRDEAVGRGGIFINNYTPHSVSYPFSSTEMLVPLVNNQTFPTADVVIVDEEQIEYNGKSWHENYGPLYQAEGELVASFDGATSSTFGFADDRTRNYIGQDFNVDQLLMANEASVYVKRVGEPEGLVVSIYADPITAERPLGTRVAYGVTTAVSDSFGWVNCKFYSPVHMDSSKSYRLVLTREKEPWNPDPANYYQVGYDAGGSYKTFASFDDNTDQWTVIAGAMPFRIYGLAAEGDHVVVTGLPQPVPVFPYLDPELYNDMALIVVEGSGKGHVFRVTGWQEGSDSTKSILALDRPSHVIAANSVMRLVPTLKVSQRGYGGTTVTAHSDSLCSVYRELSIECDRFHYLSTDMDIPLEDALGEVAGKSGVGFTCEKTYNGNVLFSGSGWQYHETDDDRENLILRFKASSEAGVAFRWTPLYGGYAVTVGSAVNLWSMEVTPVLEESVPLENPASGWVTVSVWEQFVSVWVSGRLVASFVLEEDMSGEVMLMHSGSGTMQVDWSAVDTRVDNFVLDMGSNGLTLISDLVKERRVFVQDDEYGRLRAFANRTEVNRGDPYDLALVLSEDEIDADLATRIRLLGYDVVEAHDEDLLNEYGYVFRQYNFERIEMERDLQREAVKIIKDFKDRRNMRGLKGAFAPKVEPNDVIFVDLPDGEQRLVAEQIGVTFMHSDDEAVLDMEVTAYESE